MRNLEYADDEVERYLFYNFYKQILTVKSVYNDLYRIKRYHYGRLYKYYLCKLYLVTYSFKKRIEKFTKKLKL